MKNKRRDSVISLIINLCIVIFVAMIMWINFRSDFVHDDAWFGFTGWYCFRFFTVLSNIFLAITAFIMIVYDIKNLVNNKFEIPKWLSILKFMGTVATTVTLLTVVLLLAPLWEINGDGYFTLFQRNNFFMHLVNPVLGLVTFIFFEKAKEFKFKHTLFGLIPTALYSVLYITMVFVGHWPDFYYFTFGGYMWLAPISAIVMYLLTFVYGLLIWLAQKKWANRKKKKLNR